MSSSHCFYQSTFSVQRNVINQINFESASFCTIESHAVLSSAHAIPNAHTNTHYSID